MKILKYLTIFASLFIVFQIFSAPAAKAATQFDDTVITVDKLELRNNNVNPQTIDITKTYTKYLTQCDAYMGQPSGTTSSMFNEAVANGSHAIYVNHPYSGDFATQITIQYSLKPGIATFGSNSMYEWLAPNHVSGVITFELQTPGDSNYNPPIGHPDDHVSCTGFIDTSDPPSPYSNEIALKWNDNRVQYSRQLFINTYQVQYPDGYAGQPIPDNYTDLIEWWPDYSLTVRDRRVTAKHTNDLPDEVDQPYKVRFILQKGTFESGLTFDEKFVDPKGSTSWENLEYGTDYMLYGTFVDANNVPLGETEVYKFETKTLGFDVDGNDYFFGKDEQNCTYDEVSGQHCEPKEQSLYEQCDLADLGCHFRNFQVWLKQFVINLFVLQDDEITIFKEIASPTGEGLTAVIITPLNLLNKLKEAEYTCNPVSLPLPHVNGNLNLPCMTTIYQNSFGAIFTVYQMIINGLVSYYVLTRILESVKKMKDPQNDQIELLKL